MVPGPPYSQHIQARQNAYAKECYSRSIALQPKYTHLHTCIHIHTPRTTHTGRAACIRKITLHPHHSPPAKYTHLHTYMHTYTHTHHSQHTQAGQHAYAKECYSRSIALQPNSAVAYANRAMAELRLLEWAQAEEDCCSALQLDPTHVKVGGWCAEERVCV